MHTRVGAFEMWPSPLAWVSQVLRFQECATTPGFLAYIRCVKLKKTHKDLKVQIVKKIKLPTMATH